MLEDCRFEEIVEEAVETFIDLAAGRNLELRREFDLQGEFVHLDTQAIYRCLLNLIANAADATPKEGGLIVVRACRVPGDMLDIEIADNGPGVPDMYRKKIFEPFFSTKGSRGTGLGLAVTAKIIREHGGSICVEQAPEGGAAFRITLPVSGKTVIPEETFLP
jgi:signal transduction histidine kinase